MKLEIQSEANFWGEKSHRVREVLKTFDFKPPCVGQFSLDDYKRDNYTYYLGGSEVWVRKDVNDALHDFPDPMRFTPYAWHAATMLAVPS